ncbi:alpha/beta-hydrolase [Viridothelium virens]|uniref:Kynurenine formamidase n=1 Tax=Viridothelium virens TaxID=1048519 RepID=A0A6A6H971_VIRVR|nr:alpha/beta-hydrolase [Viridothelium virens]
MTSSSTSTADYRDYPKHIINQSYSPHSNLNNLDIILLRPYDRNDISKIWIVYIHGGAWRDPRKTKSGISASLPHLYASAAASHIAGIASLNYRLSPHPTFPVKPGDSADLAARSAQHPTHINDAIDALRWLKTEWGVRDGGYVLVGHSCGGTMAMQIMTSEGRKWKTREQVKALSGEKGEEGKDTPMPRVVMPVEAITDLPKLVANHAEQNMYEDFVVGAFSKEREVWEEASPTKGTYRGEKWRDASLVILAHSKEDELVEWEQCDLLLDVLKAQGWKEKGSQIEADGKVSKEPGVRVLELRGKHDEIWEDGRELSRAINIAVERVMEMR